MHRTVYLISATYPNGETVPVTAFEDRQDAISVLNRLLLVPIFEAAAKYSILDVVLMPISEERFA